MDIEELTDSELSKEVRKRYKYTQGELAEKLGFTCYSVISRVEREKAGFGNAAKIILRGLLEKAIKK